MGGRERHIHAPASSASSQHRCSFGQSNPPHSALPEDCRGAGGPSSTLAPRGHGSAGEGSGLLAPKLCMCGVGVTADPREGKDSGK